MYHGKPGFMRYVPWNSPLKLGGFIVYLRLSHIVATMFYGIYVTMNVLNMECFIRISKTTSVNRLLKLYSYCVWNIVAKAA